MFGNPAAERAAIEMTYEDTATISRTEPATGANHITRAVPAVKYSEIICALSYSGSDKSQQTDAQNEVDYDAVIFAAPDLLVLPGDSISRNGSAVRTRTAGVFWRSRSSAARPSMRPTRRSK